MQTYIAGDDDVPFMDPSTLPALAFPDLAETPDTLDLPTPLQPLSTPLPPDADLLHDPLTCLICTPFPRKPPVPDSKDERDAEEEEEEVSLLQMNDLLFLIWDYLPLAQVWRFQHLCPRWKELLQLRPGADAVPPTAFDAPPYPRAAGEDAGNDDAAMGEENDDEEDEDALRLSDDDGRIPPAPDAIAELHLEQRSMLLRYDRAPHVHARDWKEDLHGVSEEDLLVILGARGGAARRAEEPLGGAGNPRMRRRRDWGREEEQASWRKLKRLRKLNRRSASRALASTRSPQCPAVSSAPSSSLSSSSSSSSSAANALALWSSRSYLRRLVHAKLSLSPHCTPWLTPALLQSLSSLRSLHLYSFPFVIPVFSSQLEGSEATDEEVRLLTAEKERYEAEKKRRQQEATEAERKHAKTKDDGDHKRERHLLNALRRGGHREDMEDMLRVMEIQGGGHRRRHRWAAQLPYDGLPPPDDLADRPDADDVDPAALRQQLHARLQQYERDAEHVRHPFWYDAALERRLPQEPGHFSLLTSLSAQLTSLVFSPAVLTQADLVVLSSLHALTSLSLHPHSSEGMRPADGMATFFSSFPQLTALSLYSEEATAFPLSFVPHLPVLAPSLQSLSVHAASFNGEAVHAIAALTALTSLSLSFTSEPLPASAFTRLDALTRLTSLALHTGTRLSYAVPPSLFALSTLTSLSLFGSINLHQSALQLLPSLPALQRLRVSDCFDSLNDVVKHVVECAALRVVDVRGTALSWRKREQIRFERTDVRLIES